MKVIAAHWLTEDIPPEVDQDPDEPIPSTSDIRREAAKNDPSRRLSMDMRKKVLEPILGTGKKKNTSQQCRVCPVKEIHSLTRYVNFVTYPCTKKNALNDITL